MVTTILTIEAVAGLVLFLAFVVSGASAAAAKENARYTDHEIERDEARRGELLERLSTAYAKAKRAGVHNFYLVALSHCCWTLRNGGDIDERAALLALRGLEGDAELDTRVNEILAERCKDEGDGE